MGEREREGDGERGFDLRWTCACMNTNGRAWGMDGGVIIMLLYIRRDAEECRSAREMDFNWFIRLYE